MAINTKQVAGCRDLQFQSLDEILADAQAINPQAARTLGNWTCAQIVEHVSRFITASREGFPPEINPPLVVRLPFTLARPLLVGRKPPRGVKLPQQMVDAFIPPADFPWEDALEHLRSEVEAVNAGQRLTVPSPLFGKMSHEQWVKLHCGHAAMHFGYILPEAEHSGSAGEAA